MPSTTVASFEVSDDGRVTRIRVVRDPEKLLALGAGGLIRRGPQPMPGGAYARATAPKAALGVVRPSGQERTRP
ncbi:hypothetical protein KAURM247S_04192 [Kitasatospora aureofaciens]